jgi:hypothetical protein
MKLPRRRFLHLALGAVSANGGTRLQKRISEAR